MGKHAILIQKKKETTNKLIPVILREDDRIIEVVQLEFFDQLNVFMTFSLDNAFVSNFSDKYLLKSRKIEAQVLRFFGPSSTMYDR